MKVPGGYDALRRSFAIRDYRLFVIGNLTSNVGLWTQRVALGWLTWDLTHSTAWLGGISMAEAVPTLVLALIAGTVVDRFDYFRLLRLTQTLSLAYAVAMAVLVLTGLMNIWLLAALVFVRGAVSAFNRPSRMTAVYSLVGRDLLGSAVAVNSIIFNISRFAGPAVGGGLIVGVGIGWTFVVVAGMFLVFNIMIRLIHAQGAPPAREQRPSMLAETIEGLRYMAVHRGIRIQMMVIIIVSLLAKPISDLLPGFAGRIFERGPDGLAIFLSTYGFGAMLGAFWIASRGRGLKGMTTLSIGAVLVSAAFLLLFALAPAFWIACVAIGFIGCAFIVQNVSNQTLIQSASDTAMRGRVISNYGLVNQGLPSFGTLLSGAIAEHIGLRLPIAAGAVLLALGWLWLWRMRHGLAAIMETDPVAEEAGSDKNAAGTSRA